MAKVDWNRARLYDEVRSKASRPQWDNVLSVNPP